MSQLFFALLEDVSCLIIIKPWCTVQKFAVSSKQK